MKKELLQDVNKKCIVEGEFGVDKYKLDSYFQKNDLDYINPTLIRREITPNGRSRAFVNDTPRAYVYYKRINKYLQNLQDVVVVLYQMEYALSQRYIEYPLYKY
ncbi:hypothetical protein N9Y26_01055 [bacterium]|nr:hypothetical protein [bacterium]